MHFKNEYVKFDVNQISDYFITINNKKSKVLL